MKSNLLLLIAAIIWGFAFVAQRAGMEFLGPFTFNAARFTLGSLSLIPLLIINRRRKIQNEIFITNNKKTLLTGGLSAGIFLFLGATFQQAGMVHTSAGKGGFITGFYIILVPILGLLVKQKTSFFTWLGAVIAITGLYFLSVSKEHEINIGDILVLIGAFFWAFQILVIGFFAKKTDPIHLAFIQFAICAAVSFVFAVTGEQIVLVNLYKAIIPVLYAGIFSAGIAFTLQVIAQREAHPANAAIIMSLESVFAVLGGWLLLSETIALRGLAGCILMLTGMIISQTNLISKRKNLSTSIITE
jgi:drug/metabolite transporter (DMT)-like permease